VLTLSYNQKRAIGAVLFVPTVFCPANYYLNLGFFGRFAPHVMIACIFLAIIYMRFFAPSPREIREHKKHS